MKVSSLSTISFFGLYIHGFGRNEIGARLGPYKSSRILLLAIVRRAILRDRRTLRLRRLLA